MADGKQVLKFYGGQDIASAAAELVEAAATSGKLAEGSFNDITLTAGRGTTAAQIVTRYHEELDARAEAYRKSPEGIAAKAKEKAETISRQATCDALMVEFATLDLTNDAALIDWLDRFQDPSDDMRIRKDVGVVVRALEAAGYVSGANCGPAFNEEDRDNYARYLIGQALSNLKHVGAIHQVFGTFHERWKAKFPTPSNTQAAGD